VGKRSVYLTHAQVNLSLVLVSGTTGSAAVCLCSAQHLLFPCHSPPTVCMPHLRVAPMLTTHVSGVQQPYRGSAWKRMPALPSGYRLISTESYTAPVISDRASRTCASDTKVRWTVVCCIRVHLAGPSLPNMGRRLSTCKSLGCQARHHSCGHSDVSSSHLSCKRFTWGSLTRSTLGLMRSPCISLPLYLNVAPISDCHPASQVGRSHLQLLSRPAMFYIVVKFLWRLR
jgi:hypothetical protein